MPRGLACLGVLVACAVAGAEPLLREQVPPPLKPWTDWALRGRETDTCPFLQGDADTRACIWPARLKLQVEETGGRFTQSFRVFGPKAWVALPGDARRWPQEVVVNGSRAVVVEREGAPSVLLAAGEHEVSGRFQWDAPPESLPVPEQTGLLSLWLRGQSLAYPERDADGTVFLQKTVEAPQGDALELRVFRRLTDEVPVELVTRLELVVSGTSREVTLGRVLPAGFVPLALESPLPARLEGDGQLKLQARPGRWSVELVARSEGPVLKVTRPDPEGLWAQGEEVWVFEARSHLRRVVVEGVPGVDPQQTSLPDAWKGLPAYLMAADAELTLSERGRGDEEPAPDQLTLRRTLWLDFDGRGYSMQDSLSGALHRSWRLEMTPPLTLGRVSADGRDQLITQLPGGKAGVEVRQGQLELVAESRFEGSASRLPAVGWAHDFREVSATLNLPPGWRLWHAAGVDDVPRTWLREWTLFEFFLVLITAAAVGRLFGVKWGVFALVSLVLLYPEEDAPVWMFLPVLALEALTRVVPAGRWRTALAWLRWAALGALVLMAIPFSVTHVRVGLHPQLESPGRTLGEGGTSALPGARGLATSVAGAPPPPAAAMAEAEEDAAQSLDYDMGGLSRSAAPAPKKARMKDKQKLEVDPNAVVQTGQGLPRWGWQSLSLRWSGPVTQGQELSLVLTPPWVNTLLAVLRVVLLAVLTLKLLKWTPKGWGRSAAPGAATAVLLALGAVMWPAPAAAQDAFPPDALLDKLRDRLLEPPSCQPHCASSPRLLLEATPRALRLRMEVGAEVNTAVPLPASALQWMPEQVLVDGRPASALSRSEDGQLWLALAPGGHQVVLEGPMPPRDAFQLSLPLKPYRVEAALDGWTLDGVHEDGVADEQLQLTRIRKEEEKGERLQAGTLPPFVRVQRTVRVGLTWEVETWVQRASPEGTAVVLEVPLLPGESVTTGGVRSENGKVFVSLGPTASELRWSSSLEPVDALTLTAPTSLAWTEVWRLEVSPVWHAEWKGVPPIHAPGGSERVPEWRPWPGERVEVALRRPDAVAGQTLTVDSVVLALKPGLRVTDAELSATVRSSRGVPHRFELPEGAELQTAKVNGTQLPLRQEGRFVSVPLSPGAQEVELVWREPRGISTWFRAPEVGLGAPAVNARVTISLERNRWVLALGGAPVGPTVLFWSLLAVLTAVAVGLGRLRWTPLGWVSWLLLLVGLSQLHIAAAAFVVGWLVALGLRERWGTPLKSVAWFNLMQLVLAGWTVVALGVLAAGVAQGLLGSPEMQVSGNGSSETLLRWFQDRTAGALPRPWVFSVPLLVYRAAMLGWALWLALAVLRWLRWGWGAFTQGGGWRSSPAPAPKA